MPFVGIIAENKDYEIIKKLILDRKIKIDLMQIKEKNIENIKNIKFEAVLINQETKCNREYLKKILENSKYLVINSDIKLNQEDYKNIKLQIITYGFNGKATITASSITEDSIVMCAQRGIEGINQKKIVQQECNIKIKQKEFKSPYNIMAYFAISEIYK